MIRRTLVTACTLALLGCVADPSGLPRDSAPSDDAKVAWLSANSVTVRSVEADDTDFSDLAPLRNAIGNARIVMLGEQTHGDGTTFAAKVRLIRFLHSEMDFDVLAFEAGMFDTHQAWNRIRAGDDPLAAVQQSIFGIWSKAEEVRPLFEYVAAQAASARPLEPTGIDPQFTGPVGGGTGQFVADSLEAYLAVNSPAILAVPRWPAFRDVVSRIGRQYYRDTLPTDEERDVFSELMPAVRLEATFIHSQAPAFTTSYWEQLTDAIDAQGNAWWARAAEGANSSGYSTIRDASMARNLAWMLDRGYPGRKVIVWAHNAHVQAATSNIRRLDGTPVYEPEFRALGDLTRERYGDALYTVGFLAGSGQYGCAAVQSGTVPGPRSIGPPPAGSLDDLLMRTGREHLLLDLRQSRRADGQWLNSPLVARPLFYASNRASWPTVFDAVFFSRVMVPASPVR